MKDLTPRKEELDPIEIASRDEIAALQLKHRRCLQVPAFLKGLEHTLDTRQQISRARHRLLAQPGDAGRILLQVGDRKSVV